MDIETENNLLDYCREHPEVLEVRHLPPDSEGTPVLGVVSSGYLTGGELRRHLLSVGCQEMPHVLILDDIAQLDSFTTGQFWAAEQKATEGWYPYVAPTTLTERRLHTIWSRTLSGAVIGTRDHFVDLGGDSLAAVEILSSIGMELQVDVSPADFLDAGCIRDLAKIVDGETPDAG